MNPITILNELVAAVWPRAKVEVDEPASPVGYWDLDITRPGDARPINVRWKPGGAVFVSTVGPDDYGAKPDESYPDAATAFARIYHLFTSGSETKPPQKVGSLAEMREIVGMTQAVLAQAAGLGQSAVSQFERRRDFRLNTLARHIRSLGGELQVAATFPNGSTLYLAPSAYDCEGM